MPSQTASRSPLPPPKARGGFRWKVWLVRLGIVVFGALTLVLAGIVFTIRHFEDDLPSVSDLRSYNPPQITRILARDGTLLGEVFAERRTVVPIAEIPPQMKLAALAAEDASFYEHDGLNYLGMLRALSKNLLSAHGRQGGSTITQQVIKNVLLTPERTFDRKMREVILARRIEAELSKDEILDLYLNQIYFGHGRYGVEEAARYYFGKSVRKVTLAEAALIAGIIKGPGVYSPRIDPQKALARKDFVLDQMALKGFASAEQVAAARKEQLTLAGDVEVKGELAPEVVDDVRRQLKSLVGPAADRGGYTITTTIDPKLEDAARLAVRHNADEYGKRHNLIAPLKKAKKEPAPFEGTPAGHHAYLGVVVGADDAKNTLEVRVGSVTGTVELAGFARYNPKGLPASQFAEVGKTVRVTLLSRAPAEKSDEHPDDKPAGSASAAAPEPHAPAPGAPFHPKLWLELGPESALVAVDVRSREILALVGNYEATRGGLDRASHAKRQPGSTFKSFVYSYAIHSRQMTAATIVETNPAALKGYTPQNYDESEGRTPKRLRDALAHSVNVAAVWSMQKVGAQNVATWAHSLGIESKLGADLSLALGAYEVTPREMVGAYATFAAGGVYEEPILIKKIVGPGGVEVPLPARAPSRKVMDEAEAYVMTSLLTSVVRDGTGRPARSLNRPIAGKTGTSNSVKDAWFVGYSTDLACAVWTGYDDPTPMGAGEAGAKTALPAFVEFMKRALDGKPATDFPVPAGVVRVSIDPETGLRSYPDEVGALDEVFLTGTEPSEIAKPDAGAEEAADKDAGAPLAKPNEEAPSPL